MSKKTNRVSLITGCIVLLMLQIIAVTDAGAKTKKAGVWDDDWDPVIRGRSYVTDPGYETWITEALDAVNIPYDLFEIQPDDDPTHLPSLGDLRQYTLVIWNCAAESDSSLSLDERILLRNYMALGGKLILLGQGILDDLDPRMGDPEVEDFLYNVLGLADYSLNQEIFEIGHFGGNPYFDAPPMTILDFSALPDQAPSLTDLLTPLPWMRGFVEGTPGAGNPWFNLTSGRFHPDPIHFQSFLTEAIPDPWVRGMWLKASIEWLGLEGEVNYDFMNGTEQFTMLEDCPDNLLDWSPVANAMIFDSPGWATCATTWALPLYPADQGCDWRLGFTFSVTDAGDEARFIPMALNGAGDLLRITLESSQDQPHGYFNLIYQLQINGVELEDITLQNLPVACNGPSPHAIYRVWVGHDPTGGGTTWFRLADVDGTPLHQVSTPDSWPFFELVKLESVGVGSTLNQPISGWVDDYFFEGCLDFPGIGVSDEAAAPPAGGPRIDIYPNPFNPRTRIQVRQVVAGPARVEIFDISGRRVRTLVDETRAAGTWHVQWDGATDNGEPQPSGLYLVRIETLAGVSGGRLVLLK